jgi:hypothetical protein
MSGKRIYSQADLPEILKKAKAGELKMIYVLMDMDIIEVAEGKYIFPVSHDSVNKEIWKGTDIIYTHDPSYFQFDTLLDGYDVTVCWNDYEVICGIILSELLMPEERKRYGIAKEIRWANNAYKMLMAGAGSALKPVKLVIPPSDHPTIDVLKRPIRGL